MKYSLLGGAAAMVLVMMVAAAGAVDASHYKAAKGTVSTIDRTCNFIETTTTPDGHKSARGHSDSCSLTEEWDKERDNVRDKGKRFSGNAVVHVSYTAPQDGSSRTADLTFTGRDDEFYDLQAGSEIKILVNNEDPSKIRKA